MKHLQQSTPLVQKSTDYISREVTEAISIYKCLYPGCELRFIFRIDEATISATATVSEGRAPLHVDLLGAGYLGQVNIPGPHDASPAVTISISIPRPPLPSERRQTDTPWQPQRPLRFIFRMAPMLYEQIRYLAEMARWRRADKSHRTSSLPFGGSALFSKPRAPATGKRPAILVGMHWLEVGGAEKLGLDTIRWAREAGLRVFVVASVPELQRLKGQLPDSPDVTFLRLDRYLPHHLWPRYVEELVRAENIRLIHIHHCRPLYDALPHIRTATPWVKVIDSTHIVEYADGGYPRISGVWSNFIDMHHVISGQLEDYYRDKFLVVGKVRLGRMLDRREDAGALSGFRLQAGQKSLHISFIGRLYYQKRPIIVVETFRRLSRWAADNNVELSGSLVGEGPFLPAVQRLIQRYGLQDKVALLPADTDVPALLERSDLMLLPSNNEGLALVCYEAIGRGCIPLSTDVGSQYEVVPADLLVPLSPYDTVRETLGIVDRLWRDPAFLARQKQELTAAFSKLGRDMTAKEILMPIYEETALSAG